MQSKDIIKKMPLEEKAAFCAGKDFWHLNGVEKYGLPSVMVTDGPHGLRKQAEGADHLGINESVKAICFPAGCALACSFDPELAERMGMELGKLAQTEDVSVVLGPAMNIKRSPLCGRNFEYYSEDPLLCTRIAAGTVRGIQSQNVGASPKHFLANNQEYYRMSSNSVIDEQTMREIYLAAFEEMIKETQPWTVMCSYNKINGTYACENKQYLTDILRNEWGFDGYVMTDWGALNDPVESMKAGLDLAMPGPMPDNTSCIIKAVKNGNMNEDILDTAVERIMDIVQRYVHNHKKDVCYDFESGHEIARQIETESAVLLKNDDNILPLRENENVLFIGEYVKKPRYQGGGSSHINPWRISSVWDVVGEKENAAWTQGYTDRYREKEGKKYLEEAVRRAKRADKVVIFAGLPEAYETEGVDRKKLDMPDNQNILIQKVSAVQPNTIVVLHNGSAVTMPWISSVKAVLELYLGGEASGLAAADLLYGKVNPSGRLAETFPLQMEDTPTYPYYGVEKDDILYREGRLVGYRYYNTLHRPVLFPFGHGLSYTLFEYTNLRVDKSEMTDEDTVTVTVDVTNTGQLEGKDVVQLYVQNKSVHEVRPLRELREFKKIFLKAGETKTVVFRLGKRAFSEWNTDIHDWYVPGGTYQIQICANAERVLLEQGITVVNVNPLQVNFTVNTPMGDIMAHPVGKMILEQAMGSAMNLLSGAVSSIDEEPGVMSDEMAAATAAAMPLRAMLSFSKDVKMEQLEQLVQTINQAIAQH